MLLDVEGLHAGYGNKTVLHDVSLSVGEREVVAILGHNGAGKTTLLQAIFGLISVGAGKVRFKGQDVTLSEPQEKLKAGMGYSPQGATVFRTLSVHDNLLMGGDSTAASAEIARRLESVEKLFPILRERSAARAGSLSGGERQMLALGMLLIASPRLLILDEPSGGLSPAMVDKTYDAIGQIAQNLSASVLLVEQDMNQALRIATRVYVLTNGRITFSGSADEARTPAVQARILSGV